MVGDLKTGHLLGASPASQFWAQVAGSFLGIWLSVILFVLFASAYPCVTDLTIECTAFGMPAVTAWRSVTEAVTKPEVRGQDFTGDLTSWSTHVFVIQASNTPFIRKGGNRARDCSCCNSPH